MERLECRLSFTILHQRSPIMAAELNKLQQMAATDKYYFPQVALQ